MTTLISSRVEVSDLAFAGDVKPAVWTATIEYVTGADTGVFLLLRKPDGQLVSYFVGGLRKIRVIR